MKIKGIGTVKKQEVMRILTKEGREAVKNGEITLDELCSMYKLEQVKKTSKIGALGDTFRVNYSRIPEDVKDLLTPNQLGALVDAFYECYSEGTMYTTKEHF